MSDIIAIMGSKLGMLGIGVALPLAFMLGKKFIPKYFGGIFAKLLGKGMENVDDIKDPVRKELVRNIAYDLVKLAEYECPDKGQGRVRFEKVASWLCTTLPMLKGQDKALADIIEDAVAAMDNELKKAEGPGPLIPPRS